MAKSVFDAPQFKTEEGAFAYVEAHLWPTGPVCPHCGNCDGARIRKMVGATTRMGLYKCNECRKPFTVRMGTIFESSHLALHLWLQVIHLMCASKKGVSTRQIQRMLQCSMKTAWFLSHRIREAMKDDHIGSLGGEGETVEVDETFIGGKEKNRHKSKRATRRLGGSWGKETVLSLVERNGRVRSLHVASVTAAKLRPVLLAQIDAASLLCTDDAGQYRHMGRDFRHEVVNHGADEYVRGLFHTNTVEGYFSILKRGIVGVYHHVSEKHLQRYLCEFDFRYSNREKLGVNDTMRAELALKGVVGKRLTYETTRLSA
ncbi:IS1595 family transposase [Novosphingobium sp.]|uniref:IS1595 family transposase n=1 Tax=Novosphingobium sp. TaxID=1874826 RepID=UPI0025F1C3DD|nr:IS1595 family transposase [Novosphingobium sp.]